MRVADLQYELPPELIAQEPPTQREDARLLQVPRDGGALVHGRFPDIVELVAPGDLLVLNDTRVLPARVHARRDTGGRVEVFFLEPVGADPAGPWRALLRSGGRPQAGERLTVGDALIELVAREPGASWVVCVEGGTAEALMARAGRMPLPPYIARGSDDPRGPVDERRYQTVFAREAGAVAAPTAGLHWTPALLDACRERGVEVETLTLHVGLGTFEPVRALDLDDHDMHAERYALPQSLCDAVSRTRAAGGRVIANGTTVVRALEAAADAEGHLHAGGATTRLLIQPGHTFRIVDGLITNFHLPGSTLLALVGAFVGLPRLREAYRVAVAERYRFFSYGDAMWIA